MPKAALYTLGCRLNQAETANIARDLQNRGFEIVPFGEAADLTVVNTCTVTEKADARCRQAVRKSVRKNPDTFVAVIGCYAQMAVEDIRRIEGVDLIMGNEHKMQLADYVETLDKMSEPRVVHSSKISRESFTIESVGFYDTHTRANIKIQDGCNFVCSFCIIATARGPARSRDFQDILQEAHKLAEMGHRELVLSGVNIGTYKNEDKNFLDLVAALEQVPGIERIRISSIEPTTVTRELIDYMAGSVVVCPYLHIPLQSGDDAILDSMRRKHDAAFFREIIEYAAEKIPHIGIGTDIMVGYPGEDEQAFKNSKALLADLPVSFYHVFTYSDRKGTGSYKMKPKVSPDEKKRRMRSMTDLGQRRKMQFIRENLGREYDVLFEENKDGCWFGLTGNYIRVAVKEGERPLHNVIKRVRLVRREEDYVMGEIV